MVQGLFKGGVYFVQLEPDNWCGKNSRKYGIHMIRSGKVAVKNFTVLCIIIIINMQMPSSNLLFCGYEVIVSNFLGNL